MTESLHTKYRPQSFDEVLGNDKTKEAIKKVLDSGSGRALLLTGPSGCGKSTLARIIARYVNAGDVIEVDAATYTGIDAMRQLTETMHYRSLSANEKKVYIVDEFHACSTAAFTSLLKSIEEPPDHVYWVFCTTNPDKIPITIKTRCACFEVKPLSNEDLEDLLKFVAENEGFQIANNDEAIAAIAEFSNGSPRQALVNLSACQNCLNVDDVFDILHKSKTTAEVIDLCRLLVSGQGVSWNRIVSILSKIDVTDCESVRIQIVNYIAKVLMNCKSDDKALRLLYILDCFSESYRQSEKKAPLLLSLGKIVFGEE